VVVPPRAGRPRKPYAAAPPAVTQATAHKGREGDRVVRVGTRAVLGSASAAARAVAASAAGRAVSTSPVGRHDGADRDRRSREAREGYAFSKDWEVHRAAAAFGHFGYNFCWPVRALRVRDERGRWRKRTPAMAAG
jgi:hypothetical protein